MGHDICFCLNKYIINLTLLLKIRNKNKDINLTVNNRIIVLHLSI